MRCASQSQTERCTLPQSDPHQIKNPDGIGKGSWRTVLLCILIATGLSAFWGVSIANRTDACLDFKAVYFGARCLLEGHNPYDVSQLSAVYKAAGGEWPGESPVAIEVVTRNINLPTTLVFVAPFAVLPFGLANALWLTLAAVFLVIAAFVIWSISAKHEREFSLLLILFLLTNCELVFKGGNTALLVVSLCVTAAWSIAEGRFGFAGAVCLGVCLAVKPHDSGWVWLYLLLAGGMFTRRALQALGVCLVTGASALLWIGHVAPQWMSYWRANLATSTGPGGLNEPGPHSLTAGSADKIINLQSAISVLWNRPEVYNTASYLICGALLLACAVFTIRRTASGLHVSRERIWLGLATVAAPTLLITYHRGYDTKLLLLAVPACAMLWSKRGVLGWSAVLFTSAALVFTGDIPLAIQAILRDRLPIAAGGILERGMSAVLLEPTPVVLLAMGVFYVWAYLKSAAIEVAPQAGDPVCEDSFAPACTTAVAAVGTRG